MRVQTLAGFNCPLPERPRAVPAFVELIDPAGGLGCLARSQPALGWRPSPLAVMESPLAGQSLRQEARTTSFVSHMPTGQRSLLTQGQVVAPVERPSPSTEAGAGREGIPYIAVLRQLIEDEQVPAARKLLAALPTLVPDDPSLGRLRAVLAAPTVKRTRKRDTNRKREYDWLRRESYRYRGQWVALDESGLVASSPTLRELQGQLKALRLARPLLLHRVE